VTEKLLVFIAGAVFAVGLGISGMTDANKVINFLNPLGQWDPSLAFVMVGGIGAHLATHRLILRREQPLFAAAFSTATATGIDKRLLAGAGLFGMGWGLGGFCPGPGIVSAVALGTEAMVFVGTMVGGMVLFHLLDRKS
jgi:uncharacterized membrane protein YedE/YeeE